MKRRNVGPVPLDPPAVPDEGGRRGWRARVVDHSLGDAAGRAVDDGRALIAAASRLIMRSGGADFTMHNVAAEAGVSRRVLYRLFGGRDDLILALLEESSLVYARLLAERADRFSDPVDRLCEVLYFATDPRQLTDRDYNAAMIRISVETSVRSPKAIGGAHRPLVDVLAGLCKAAIDAGRIRRADPYSHARMLVLALTAYQQSMFLGASEFDPTRQDEFVNFCMSGLGAEVQSGWPATFRLSDEDAAIARRRTTELSDAIRRSSENMTLVDENATSV